MSNDMASESDSKIEGGPDGSLHRGTLVLVLLALAVLAYSNAIFHPFVYDDNALILKNPEIRSLQNIPEMMGFNENGFQPRGRASLGRGP